MSANVTDLTGKQLHEKWAAFDSALRALTHTYVDFVADATDRQDLYDACLEFVRAFDDYTDGHFRIEHLRRERGES